jgi:prepilin-type N-terminal cleavage/methylation domain-containing protein
LNYYVFFGEIDIMVKKKNSFTLVETLVVIAVIGILATFVLSSLTGGRKRARDSRRKSEIAQMGRFLTLSCYLPDGGEGEYDLVLLANEILSKYPQYDQYLSVIPQDPKTGTETESKYVYTVNVDGTGCALYANLENENETVTLSISVPTPGGGTGVLKASTSSWNGTSLYFQYSN